MEQSPFHALSQSSPLLSFPPHRRRHLKSETYSTFVQILSHCYGKSHVSQSHKVALEDPDQGKGENELVQVPKEARGEPVCPASVEAEILSIQRDVPSSKAYGVDEVVDEDQMETDEVVGVHWANEELIQKSDTRPVNAVQDKNPSCNAISSLEDQKDQSHPLEICMEESGNVGQVVTDKEPSNSKDFEDLDILLDTDILIDFPKIDNNDKGGSSFTGRNFLEAGHKMQLVESIKLLTNSSSANSVLVTADEGIEEGEILFEDNESLEKNTEEEEQNVEAIVNLGQLSCNKEEANQEKIKHDKHFGKIIDKVGNGEELKFRGSSITEMERKSETLILGGNGEMKMAHGHDSALETGKNENQVATTQEEFNQSAVPTEILRKHTAENKHISSPSKDVAVKKKKKRGPSTKEKKKEKKRIKRAEKNRQLGIKRLKIQPVLKPKNIAHCRHFIKGRCHEGDNCKFSHDIIPLTKSKPCCHFARQSCMKGDDCPFDHQLSKYPCNNYLSNGSCNRGANCLFSHQMPHREGSPSTINTSTPDVKISPLLTGPNSDKQLNSSSSSFQKIVSESGSIMISSCKKTENNLAGTMIKPIVQTPKGLSKLLFGKSSLGDPTKLNHLTTSSPIGGSAVKSNMIQNSSEFTKMRTAVEARGINIGNTLHESSSKKLSNIQQSTSGDSGKDKFVMSSPKKEQGTRDLVHSFSGMPKQTPTVPPRGINFLSFGKALLDNPSTMKLPTVPSVKENVTSCAQEGSKPRHMLSSLLSSDQPQDRAANESCKDTPSSALRALLSKTPSSAQKACLANTTDSAQKALMSTLAFAAKYESRIKKDPHDMHANLNKESSSKQNTSRGSTIFDLLYGGNCKK
ncbi:hypothetical protein NMG60_11036672 [Bertholletia excelsa]